MENKENGFYGLGIAPGILEILKKLNLTTPTPIQVRAIPVAMEGKDVMGVAQTGTGKTLAFGIPLIQKVLNNKTYGLIIAPTRELAIQIAEELQKVGRSLGLRTAVLIGGEPIGKQFHQLSRNPHIIIGTPGRIVDHLEQRSVSFANTHILVLDEADRMLDMGFARQLRIIMGSLPKERQTMLFSATIPEEIINIARNYLKLPIRVEVARSGSTAEDITQELFIVPQEDKPRLLEKVLQDYRGSVLIFCRTKHAARKITALVKALGHESAEIHSNRSLSQRKDALSGFKTGKYRVLVATDIASRGIDVRNIELIINYDLPENPEDYVHRVGRTGRAGDSGHAISFTRPDQKKDVLAIERLTRSYLPITKLPALPEKRKLYIRENVGESRGYGQRGGGRSRFGTRRTPGRR